MKLLAILAILLTMSNMMGASAAIDLKADTSGNGHMEMETDTWTDRSRLIGNGETSAGISMEIDKMNSSIYKGLITHMGRFESRTPEYHIKMIANDIDAEITTERKMVLAGTEFEREMMGDELFTIYTDTYNKMAETTLSATGNGTIEESLSIATNDKWRTQDIFKTRLNGTMLDIKRKLKLTGIDVRKRMEKITTEEGEKVVNEQ